MLFFLQTWVCEFLEQKKTELTMWNVRMCGYDECQVQLSLNFLWKLYAHKFNGVWSLYSLATPYGSVFYDTIFHKYGCSDEILNIKSKMTKNAWVPLVWIVTLLCSSNYYIVCFFLLNRITWIKWKGERKWVNEEKIGMGMVMVKITSKN